MRESFVGSLQAIAEVPAATQKHEQEEAALKASSDDAAAAPAEPATATDDATGASPEIEVGAAQTLPAAVTDDTPTTRKLKFGSRRLDAEVRRKLKFGAGRRLSEDN